MATITKSGKDHLVDTFKKTHDAKPGTRDAGYELLSQNASSPTSGSLAIMLRGVGEPIDAGIVEGGVLYYDTAAGELWIKAGGSWVKLAVAS